jgi:hypothetical protein
LWTVELPRGNMDRHRQTHQPVVSFHKSQIHAEFLGWPKFSNRTTYSKA